MTTNLEYINCTGVRTHNLKNINLKLPLKKWITITGVSGSGKSSFAFDTIYSEAQRRFLETLGTYERQFIQGLPQGDFDEIENIPAAIALKQTNRTGDPRSVIATASDVAEPIRTLFISLMEPSCINCGFPVTINPSSDLITFLNDPLKKKSNDVYIISVPYFLQNKKFINDLIFEGYTRIFFENNIVNLEDFLSVETEAKLPLQIEIILDRIHCNIDNQEILNRVETIWSQVKFSPIFSKIKVTKYENSELKNSIIYYVQPFCQKCNYQTKIIQSSDLDWQSILGSCKRCNGLGNIPVLDETKIIPNPSLSISEGAVKPWTTDTYSWLNKELLQACKKKNIRTNIPYLKLSENIREWIWNGDSTKNTKNPYVSIKNFFETLEQEKYKNSSRILLAKYRKYILCPECEGARIGKSGKNAICFGKTYHEIFQSEISDTLNWLKQLKLEVKFEKKLNAISEIYEEALKKISLLNQLGLGSAHLFRRCKTLSGGEYQRVLLTRVIGNGLTDALYILDEPSVGLGKNEIPTLIECIKELRDLGNTIIMVEHDKDLILASDQIIEFGPEGGEHGGQLLPIQNGIPSSCLNKYSNINENILKTKIIENNIHNDNKNIFLKSFSALNCKDIDLEIIIGKLNVISGPSGAGKSTLIHYGLEAALEKAKISNITNNIVSDYELKIGTWKNIFIPKDFFISTEIVSVDQKALHRTTASIPATILGFMDILRKNFASTENAKRAGLSVSDFSFNGAGGCETCNGKGIIQEDLFFLGEVEKICPDCNGSRYRNDILEIRWNNKNINEWLLTSFNDCKLTLGKQLGFGKIISLCCQLGLGHIPLGMPTTSMSGGEAQRLRLCAALTKSNKKLFCILDEPTRGLSEKDIEYLLDSLLYFCSQGHTFVIVEHHYLFQTHAHQLIKIGPGSGNHGGKIIERILAVAK